MPLKIFRKPAEPAPRFQQDSTLADALVRRVNAIDFQPSKGFLKDQWQQKRSSAALQLDPPSSQQSDSFGRHVSA